MSDGLLTGQVAIITGAGGGLGRAYARLFASEGAAIVVNDLGGDRHGSGSGSSMADSVVAEIRDQGGQAVASHDSVVDGAPGILATALEAFGQVDILVNNAGILRDKSLLKMTDEMWAPVLDVHLTGTFRCLQTIGRHLKEAGRGGRILNTSSVSGLIGNFGQANYAAAKAGIAGLTRVAAVELARSGIAVNAIAPIAKTRMTEDLPHVSESLAPERIAPVALWLCSSLAEGITGRIFGAHGTHVFEYRMMPTPGVRLTDGDWTPETLTSRLAELEAL